MPFFFSSRGPNHYRLVLHPDFYGLEMHCERQRVNEGGKRILWRARWMLGVGLQQRDRDQRSLLITGYPKRAFCCAVLCSYSGCREIPVVLVELLEIFYTVVQIICSLSSSGL